MTQSGFAQGRLRPAAAWLSLLSVILAALAASVWALTPGVPSVASERDGFSESRARVIVDHLSEGIGVRVNGTPPHRQAAEFLASELRKLPRVEVEIQEAAGVHRFATTNFPTFVYRTLNVLARLPGRSAEAVLVDAHFDTALDSVGAADDAAGVAVAMETMRALASEAPLHNTVVLNLNGAEEIGLLGAAAFLEHRWAADVKAYVYVEALPGGKAMLFGAGPGNPWLARSYARAVPEPFGSSVGRDLVNAKLLPHNGDFTPFHEAGLAGLDVAMTGDGWAYHTMLDRSSRLAAGSLEHLGESTLAVTRALAAAPFAPDERGQDAVYFDVLGATMITYPTSVARVLAALALLLGGAVTGRALRRQLVSWRGLGTALGWTLLSVLGGLVAAIAGGALIALGLGRPFGWFSRPGLVVLAFGVPAAAGFVGVQALWRKRALRRQEARSHANTALAGGLLFWSLLLALATAKQISAGYLACFWVTGGALALLMATSAPGRPSIAGLACLAPAILLTVELAVMFLSYFLPITGMLSLPAIDVPVAALVALPVVMIGSLALPNLAAEAGFSRVALGLAVVGIGGLGLCAARFPYTETRPKRIAVSHVSVGAKSVLRVRFKDAVGAEELIAALPHQDEVPWVVVPGEPFSRERPAPPPPMPSPNASVVSEEQLPDGSRRVTLHIQGTSPLIRVAIPQDRLRGWSLAPSLASTPAIDGRYVAQLYALEPAGVHLTLTLAEGAPAEIEVRATSGARASGRDVEAVLKALPTWVTATATAYRSVTLKI